MLNNTSSNYIHKLHIIHHFWVSPTQISPRIVDVRWHIFGLESRTSQDPLHAKFADLFFHAVGYTLAFGFP
jgi:hypothetical protein